ncbi:hypothetical protein [Roseovarius sp.]|uniref:hypothetical protein n=1 Tax=Roseovarius sp. TaxID=1486281 RepID=UPI0035678D94
MADTFSPKRLVIHLGYHKTGSSSIQQWLLDHRSILSEHMACYNLADGSSNPLKFAAHSMIMGLIGPAKFHERALEWAEIFRNVPQNVILYTDEGIPGLPLGSLTRTYRETDIYPRAAEIVRILSEAFAEFDPIFVVFEREPEAWLKSLHNQNFKQGCLSEDYWEFVDRYDPKVDWAGLRAQLAQAIETGSGGRGRLIACSFEQEFAKPAVSDMALFQFLGLPESAWARCSPQLGQVNPSRPLVARPPQKLHGIVLGGSNSMIERGWVNLLRVHFTQLAGMQNLSVGACTTAMGLYRLLSSANRPPEAAVFWEYGVHEYNHLTGGQSLDSLLYHVEWLIQICIRERRPLIPVLMRNRTQVDKLDDPYVPALKRLFASYGVQILDVQMLITVLARGEYKPNDWYRDDAHYKVDTPLMISVAEHAMMLHRQARPPVQRSDRAAHFDALDLNVVLPQEAPRKTLEDGMMKSAYTPFGENPSVRIAGRPLAAIIATSGSGPAIEIETGPGSLLPPISTQVDFGPKIPRRQLRQIVLSETAEMDPCERDMVVRPIVPETWPQTQNMFVWKAPPEAAPNPMEGNGLVAVLCEAPRR